MIIKHSVNNQVDIVELTGQLVMANAAEAQKALKKIVEGGSNRLVIDFSGVDFMDSSGLSVLVLALKWIHAQKGRMALSNVSAKVQSLLALTRLNEAFEIFASAQAAADHLREET